MVRWQQTLKIDHIPAQLTPIRPHHPSFRHRRFPRPSATENHSPSESANSFTRSQAGIQSSINVLLDARLRGHDTGPAWADCALL